MFERFLVCQGGYQIRTSDQILSNIQAWSQNSLRMQQDCVSFLEPSEKEFLFTEPLFLIKALNVPIHLSCLALKALQVSLKKLH